MTSTTAPAVPAPLTDSTAPESAAAAPAVAPAVAPPTTGRLVVDSPLGRILLLGDDEAVTRLEIETAQGFRGGEAPDAPTAVLERAASQLREYFAGDRHDFDVPIRLGGTAFQRAIWAELDAIPFGEVRSYGELGRATGRATAGRAVGGAVGANPVPLLVPCHRVLAGDRRITGYSAGRGVPTKAWLLDHEGIAHR
ncbi:methylated-DNA--[protein]-cysteine S-methyltransferase [Microcella alkalica]|uniref:Methylated-DNA--protein-cysteine methyltransferase n=1 Tax=Microcella alkalica TaxID=355930 RepID=A0A839E6L4_9MICO|nr:methylated-DNA--[protein]-cysteine S-methyltransferase [Microcella alkalica]MBA8846773.1 methylated-DNA-[protein]-cysteine S-methyltransferase [Microcella alkalica]